MARITVEDCLDKVDNRFELVMVSSKRARQIQTGGRDPMVPADNDKPTVIALREIADGFINASILTEKQHVEMDSDTATEQLEEAVAQQAADNEKGKEQQAAESEED